MSALSPIPFVNTIASHSDLHDELLSVFETVLRTDDFVGGSLLEDFEREFSRYCDTRYCAGVGSGTDALMLALIAAGVGPGDTVVTVTNTCLETAEAISRAGARPDFVDIDERTYNMDWVKLQEYLETCCDVDHSRKKLVNKKTSRPVTAVVPVHLYGQMADMDPLIEIARQFNLIVIEDACHAHGAEYFSNKVRLWRKAGSMGDAAAFSFSPGLRLGACGKAGAVTTNDADLAQRVRIMRDHGQNQANRYVVPGFTSKMDNLQAAILQVKLKHLPKWTKKCRENAFCYHGLLSSGLDRITIPHEPSWARACYQMYVIRLSNRDRLKSYLSEMNIAAEIHYPIPIHCQESYRDLGYTLGDFPVAEAVTSEILSLPIYPKLEFDQQHRVAQRVLEFAENKESNQPSLYILPSSRSPEICS
jgi:dTDP-4-amino-4,6-dideoxygalactose transaminase